MPEVLSNLRNKRPLAVTIIASVYLAVGAIGLVFHFGDSLARPSEGVWVELTELLAIVSGVFLLLRRNWARWLALAWMAFHVVLSVSQIFQLVVHSVLLGVIAWFLLRPEAGRYFDGALGRGSSADR